MIQVGSMTPLLQCRPLEAVLPAYVPRVVIVGGGFGELYAVRALAGARVSITLVDRRNYHPFRPMLYQVPLSCPQS
jgi:ribulose 1,5-bisphosphate synthetase/thiazole synthase